MKLKNLIKLPEKKEVSGYHAISCCNKCREESYNQAVDQIGNIGVELDAGKIISIMLSMSHRDKLGEAIADNLKDLIK